MGPEVSRNDIPLGLGDVPGEQSFIHENERNYQEQSHLSKKNEHIERVLKNIETIITRTNVEQTKIA